MNGLQDKYSDQMDFYSLNAEDNDQGQEAYNSYGLRGHPSILIVDRDGTLLFQATGLIDEPGLQEQIDKALKANE